MAQVITDLVFKNLTDQSTTNFGMSHLLWFVQTSLMSWNLTNVFTFFSVKIWPS